MKVPQPFPYQGSKRNLAPAILGYFPEGVTTLIEPFAGSAAITLHAATQDLAERFVINDLNEPLPFPGQSFDAVVSLDVVLHLQDRAEFFQEVARLLTRNGRFLFTDAGVITGPISSEDVRKRSAHGYTQFVIPGWNEQLLASAGLSLIETEDRTHSVWKNAEGRLAAMTAHRAELERLSSASAVFKQEEYLEAVIGLSKRRALSRVMYLVEHRACTAV